MSKIDYSQFYMKNYFTDKNQKKKSEPIVPPQKSKKKFPFIFLTLILIITLLGANFLLDGKPYETVKGWIIKDNNSYYYLLIKTFNERDKAYAQSLLIRQLGAGGYIYQKDSKYIVIYSVYDTEEKAIKVAEKNLDTEVVKRAINESSPFYQKINSAITEILSSAEQLEAGTIYEARLLEITSIMKTSLADEKQTIINEKNAKSEYVNLLDLLIGGLSSLKIPSPTRTSLLSDLRYIASSAIISTPES